MNKHLSNRQIAFMLFGVIVGYGSMDIAKNVVENAGSAGWITLIISTSIAMIITYIITYIGYIHENQTLYEYSEKLIGRNITAIFIIIYVVYFFSIFTMITRMTNEVIRLTILVKTPVWTLNLIFLLVVYYAVIKELRIISTICEFYGILIIFAAVFIEFIIFTQGKLINLRPFLGDGNIQTYIEAVPKTIFPFLGMEVIVLIPLHREDNTKIFKYVISMIGVIGFLYIIIVESCISVIGVDDIVHYKDTFIAVLRRTDVPYLEFLRRLDGVFLIIWIMSVFCTIIIFAYGTVFFISKYVKNIKFSFITLIVLIVSFIVSQIPKTIDEVQESLKYIGYLGLVCSIVIPVILLSLTKVKKYDKKIQ